MSNTVFDKDSMKKIEQAVTVLREIQDSVGAIYWEKHKTMSNQGYASTSEQLDEMTKLGELAKGLQILKKATSDLYCFTIHKN